MLGVFITVSAYHYTLLVIDSYSQKKLDVTDSVDGYLKERSRLLILRRIIFFLFYILSIATQICGITYIYQTTGTIHNHVVGVVLTLVLFPLYARFMGRFDILASFSTKKADDIVKSGAPFVLYLRPFVADEALDDPLNKMKTSRFSEFCFFQSLGSYIKAYAVGVPLEYATPIGVERWYISHDSWQEEVHMMIKHAALVVNLLGNTEPCRWEIKNNLAMKKDCVVIVDDLEAYKACRESDPVFHNWPEPSEVSSLPFAIIHRGNEMVISAFDNTLRGNTRLVQQIFKLVFNVEGQDRLGKKGLYVMIAVILLGLFIAVIVTAAYVTYSHNNLTVLSVLIGLASLFIVVPSFWIYQHFRNQRLFFAAMRDRRDKRQTDFVLDEVVPESVRAEFEAMSRLATKHRKSRVKKKGKMDVVLSWIGKGILILLFFYMLITTLFFPLRHIILSKLWTPTECYVCCTETVNKKYDKMYMIEVFTDSVLGAERVNNVVAECVMSPFVKQIASKGVWKTPGYVCPSNPTKVYVPALEPDFPVRLICSDYILSFIGLLGCFALFINPKSPNRSSSHPCKN